MIVTLIGYRGSGKSTVAAPLALRLGFDWIDADAEIEQRAGRSIRNIFADEGESGFRRRERDLLSELLGGDRLVIAAGGGAVLDAQTRRRMSAAGPVVWLQAPAEVLARRIADDDLTANRRPDLTTTGGRSEIDDLLAARSPLYRATATLTIDTDNGGIQEIAERIVTAIDPDAIGPDVIGPVADGRG